MAATLEETSLLQLARSSSRTLELYLEDAADVARALATQDAVVAGLSGDAPRARDRFRNYIDSYKQYWAIFAFDTAGKIVAGFNANTEDMAGGSRADRDYVQGVVAGKDLVFSDKVISAKTGDILIFVVAKAVRAPDGRLLGGVAVCPKWNVFTSSFIDPIRFGRRGYGFMLDAAGTVIAHAVDKPLVLTSLADQNFVKEALARKDGILAYDWKGERKYMGIARVGTTGWLVCMSAYESEMTATAVDQRNMLLGIGALVLLAVVACITLATRALVLRPLTAVERYTQAVTAGDLRATLAGVFRFELAELAANLRRMVAELKNKLASPRASWPAFRPPAPSSAPTAGSCGSTGRSSTCSACPAPRNQPRARSRASSSTATRPRRPFRKKPSGTAAGCPWTSTSPPAPAGPCTCMWTPPPFTTWTARCSAVWSSGTT